MIEKSVCDEPQTIREKTDDMEKFTGYFTFYWDVEVGKIWLEIDKFDVEFLYQISLPAGLGSDPIGLDRNRLGSTRVVRFKRFGPKILLKERNYSFRAVSDNSAERRAVEDSFTQSVIWGSQVEAEEEGRVLVDASSLFLRDAYDAIGVLKEREQGDYKLDLARSAIYLPMTKNFPRNTEVEVILTFSSEDPGDMVREVATDPKSITVRQRHSLIQLPDDDYQPRAHDPRSMFNCIRYQDYATPVGQSVVKMFITRYRLKKRDPEATMSDPLEPIVYYVDPAIPEPIRSAVIEGASWWNEAFEAIGYRDAFQVKMLPKEADLMDVRYNTINWIHRSTRGYSYGYTIMDPRTGEIMKGHVSFGSWRVRQLFRIAQGLVANYEGREVPSEAMEMALARIRQLSVHEVGHTLGVAHNYASSVNDRASVIDYPGPLVKITEDGSLDLSDAYATGIGEWDKVSIAYGYQDFPDGVDEERELKAILDNAFSRGLHFAASQDGRGPDRRYFSSAHPLADVWCTGRHPVDELERVMRVRSIALEAFSEKRIPVGTPMATLEEVLVTTYMFHSFEIEAASSVLGGLKYHHTIRGGAQRNPEIVPAPEQRRALNVILKTIQPENLAIPEEILKLIPPRPPEYPQDQELFEGHTGLPFDPLAAAEILANLTVEAILHPERAARLIEYHSRDTEYPGLIEVMDRLISSTWESSQEYSYHAEIQRVVNNVVLYNLMKLAADEKAAAQIRAIALLKLVEMKDWLSQQIETSKDERQKAHYLYALSQIKLYQENPDQVKLTAPLPLPKRDPI